MATPRIDHIASEFLKRIPDEFKKSFTPGTGKMPDGYVLTAEQTEDYVNRAMLKLFNMIWNNTGGKIDLFIRILPEMVKFSDELQLTNGNYTIKNPYLNFKQIIGAVKSTDNSFIKVWFTSKYTIALSGNYAQYTATESKPAIIQVNDLLAVFPQDSSFKIKIHYVAVPVNPNTGLQLKQNGDYDSPFKDDWNTRIADIAEELYLKDSYQTT